MTAQQIGVKARNYSLGLLVVVYTFNFIDRQILSILLPAIKVEFDVGDTMLGFLAGPAFALFYATLGVPIALLADRYSRRNLIAAALAIWSGMTALSGLATSMFYLTLARIGVGIGEAGCSPPAHSLIADYFPPERRATALGIYTIGISVGIMTAFMAGGWVAQNIGWREAFYIVGVPGLLLAVLVRFTLVEPPRGSSEGRSDEGEAATMSQVGRFLMKRRSFIHIALGSGLASFAGYTNVNFFPSFMVRSHGMTLAEVGFTLGLIYGIAGAIGFAGGGAIADKLALTNKQLAMRGMALATVLAAIASVPVYLLADKTLVLTLFVIPAVISNFYLATMFAQTQSMVGLRMRAVAAAFLLLIINIIGLGLGPFLTGILSDYLAADYGVESLRYSLLIVAVVIGPWAALHFFLAGNHIDHDLTRVNEN